MTSWVVNPVSANAVALTGSIFTIAMWIAPVWDVWVGPESVFQTSGESIPATSLAYVAGVFTCILWLIYGSTRGEQMLTASLVNSVGLALNLSFTLCFLAFARDEKRRQIQRELVLFNLVFLIALIGWAASGSNNIVGIIAMLVNIASESLLADTKTTPSTSQKPILTQIVTVFYGPLISVRSIIRSKTTRGLPLVPIVMQFIQSIFWTAWAIYLQDVPIVISNLFGFAFASLLLGLWIRLSRYEKRDHEHQTIGLDEDGAEFQAIHSSTFYQPARESTSKTTVPSRDEGI